MQGWHSLQRKHSPLGHAQEPFVQIRPPNPPQEVPFGSGVPPVQTAVPPEHINAEPE